jgi:hypothetical protein
VLESLQPNVDSCDLLADLKINKSRNEPSLLQNRSFITFARSSKQVCPNREDPIVTPKSKIDSQIRAALKDNAPSDLLAEYDEQPLFAQAMQIFRGRNRWINSVMVVCSLICVGMSIYAAYRFYWAVDIKELLAWSVAFLVGILAVSIMKIWAWLEMEKYSTIREMKRLELQVVALRDEFKVSSQR